MNNPHPEVNLEDEVISRIGNANIVVNNISTPITRKVLNKCKQLQFIQTWSSGTGHIGIKHTKTKGVKVANVPDFSEDAVAELTLGLMILGIRRIIEANKNVINWKWNSHKFVGRNINGKRICLVGDGKISNKVANLLTPFGVNISQVNSKTSKERFHKLLSTSDIISLHCPLNDKSYHMLSSREFDLMNNAIIINTARGALIDPQALQRAIDNGNVMGACLDVLEREPPIPNDRFLNNEKIFIIPHLAWNTIESNYNLSSCAIENIANFLKASSLSDLDSKQYSKRKFVKAC